MSVYVDEVACISRTLRGGWNHGVILLPRLTASGPILVYERTYRRWPIQTYSVMLCGRDPHNTNFHEFLFQCMVFLPLKEVWHGRRVSTGRYSSQATIASVTDGASTTGGIS